MPVYKYLAVDLLTDRLIAELPLAGVRYGQILNRAGSMDASTLTLPVGDANAARDYLDGTDPNRRGLLIERDGVIVWDGWWRNREFKQAGFGFDQLRAEERWSIFHWREVRNTLTYSDTTDDQLAIARSLVAYAQAKPGGDLGVGAGSELSGVKRQLVVNFYEARKVGQIIEDMTDNIDGFDFTVETAVVGEDIIRTFRCFYPRRGHTAVTTGLVFEWGSNIVDLAWPDDGTNSANSYFAIGAGEGDAMLRSTAAWPEKFDEGYPLLEDSLSLKEVSIQATLDGHAQRALQDQGVPVSLPKLTVLGDVNTKGEPVDPQYGSYVPGDEARISIPAGQTPRFPDGLDTYRRIVAIDVHPPDDQNGVELVDLTFDQAVA